MKIQLIKEFFYLTNLVEETEEQDLHDSCELFDSVSRVFFYQKFSLL